MAEQDRASNSPEFSVLRSRIDRYLCTFALNAATSALLVRLERCQSEERIFPACRFSTAEIVFLSASGNLAVECQMKREERKYK